MKKMTPLKENTAQNVESWELDPRSSAFQPFEDSVRTAPDMSALSLSERGSTRSSPSENKREETSFGPIGQRSGSKASTQSPARSYTGSSAQSARISIAQSTPFSHSSHPSNGSSNGPATPYTPYTAYTPENERVVSGADTKDLHERKESTARLGVEGEVTIDRPEEIGRYLMINHIPKHTSAQQLQIGLKDVAHYKLILAKHLRQGCAFVAFFDPREALKMYSHLLKNTVRLQEDGLPVQLQCMKVEQDVVEKEAHGLGAEVCSMWDFSEATIAIEIVGGYEVKLKHLETILTKFGDVMWTQEVGKGRKFLVEFFDTRQAAYAQSYLEGLQVNEARFMANFHAEDVFDKPRAMSRSVSGGNSHFTLGSNIYTPGAFSRLQTQRPYLNNDPFADDRLTTTRNFSATIPSSRQATPITPKTALPHPAYPYSPSEYTDPSCNRRLSFPGSIKITPGGMYDSFSYNSPPHPMSSGKRPDEIRDRLGFYDTMAPPHRMTQSQAASGHWDPNDRQRIPEQNRVIPERIISGLDSRTTVMVKDVPNKLSRQEMVNILNEVVPGGFDFVYLRFDFNNCCNVGYAFVNFTSVKSLYEFIIAKVGKKWNMFSSEKVLQLSYANIQGKAALINKFRNSAVMTVIEQWRPQLFYSSGALQGVPEPFPEPDNLAQRQRSSQLRLSALEGVNASPCSERDIYDYDYAPSMLERGF